MKSVIIFNFFMGFAAGVVSVLFYQEMLKINELWHVRCIEMYNNNPARAFAESNCDSYFVNQR